MTTIKTEFSKFCKIESEVTILARPSCRSLLSHLFNPGHSVSLVDEHIGVLLEGGLREADVSDLLLHEQDPADLRPDDGVHVEQLVKLAHLEEEKCVHVFALHFPPLPEKLNRVKSNVEFLNKFSIYHL